MSTVPRAAEMERSSGGETSGVAIIAASTKAATPMAASAQRRTFRGNQISQATMTLLHKIICRELCLTEYMEKQGQSPIRIGAGEQKSLIWVDPFCSRVAMPAA